MGAQKSKIVRAALADKPVKVLVTGVSSSGKTQLICRLRLDAVASLAATAIGSSNDSDQKQQELTDQTGDPVDGTAFPQPEPHHFGPHIAKLNGMTVMDMTSFEYGGRGGGRFRRRYQFPGTSGIVFTVDSTDLRLEETIMELKDITENQLLNDVPMLILANKNDLPGALSTTEIAHQLDLNTLLGSRKWSIESASVKTGAGVHEGLEWLSGQICIRLLDSSGDGETKPSFRLPSSADSTPEAKATQAQPQKKQANKLFGLIPWGTASA